jgi:hypothetical protein
MVGPVHMPKMTSDLLKSIHNNHGPMVIILTS